jgi:hypothetical protein
MSDKNLLFNFKHTRFSRDLDIQFLLPCVNIPQTENTRSTKACDAGAEFRSSAKSAIKPE